MSDMGNNLEYWMTACTISGSEKCICNVISVNANQQIQFGRSTFPLTNGFICNIYFLFSYLFWSLFLFLFLL